MPRSPIRRIHLAAVGTGGQVISAGPCYFHGFILSETAGSTGTLKFLTAAANSNGNDGPATITSPLSFQRSLASQGDILPFAPEDGIFYPGGLAVVVTGGAAVTGDVYIS